MEKADAIKLSHISKSFGTVKANDDVTLSVKKGEILAVLGENGSGKTTLMNMLSGIYFPDEGSIFVDGKEVIISSPKDAFDHGIGMIHQHFKLVDILTAAENVILGLPGPKILKMDKVFEKIQNIADLYGFEIDPSQKVYDMSVSQKQTVEILKVLYRGAEILILDEPTAVLTPQEIDKLFAVIKNMKEDGKSIIIITHKLQEVLDVSDRVAVLRKGKYIGTVDTKDATVSSLTEMMVGEKVVLDIKRAMPVNPEKRLVVKDLNVVNFDGIKKLDNINFYANSGEILGIAGISGSGQKELLEAIAGLQKVDSGAVDYYDPDGNYHDLLKLKAEQIKNLGISMSFVPEDRLGMGLVGSMGMVGNMLLRSYNEGRSIFTNKKDSYKKAEEIIDKLQIKTPGVNTPVRRLSGGNVQKVLVGREISLSPNVLMVAYPVRGLDINSSYMIYNLLNEQKEAGVAVICVGEDLDVLLELCDTILVLNDGKVGGFVDARKSTKEELGLMMTHDNAKEAK
ncbi:MAG: ABC transporter ATP-binding protein [Lachnospiraceae bacterium]|nr:ABC transporter ATP-binding protein [Lachnospiraceae bacterium]